MAGKPKRMSQIKQLLQLHEQGQGIKYMARSLRMSKNTVKAYLTKLTSLPLTVTALLKLDDPVLEGMFHAGNPAYKDERYEHFKTKLDYFTQELKKRGVTRNLLWEEYLEAYPGGYGRTQFNFHLSQNLVARKPSAVLQHKPGERLYIDFAGDPLFFIDPDTGEQIRCQVFVACLPYSDYCFAIAVRSQSVEDFLYALGCCLQALGGVPEILVPDNLKAAIIKASRYEPDVNRALEDFANHYGTTVIPARAYKPKDKALVENEVGIIYTRVYAKLRHQQFFSLASLNDGIRGKIKDHNQTRMQLKPYSREEKFLADEKHLLHALPEQPFELKYYRELTVAKNNHILLFPERHYYSVPYPFIGSTVKVIYTRTMVHIYAKGEQVALHVRDYRPGEYTSVPDHLCSAHRHYRDRSPDYYLRKAKAKSEDLHQLMELLFKQNRHPEQLYRTCDGLMSLQRKTEADTFSKACKMAIDCQNYSYRFVANILDNKMTDEPETAPAKPLPVHNNLRGREYYTQKTIDF
jgi:transposase